MDTKWKVVIVTLVAGAVGMQFQATSPLGAMLWPETEPGAPEPSSSELPWLIVIAVIEGIAFGLGVSFLAFGWSKVTNAPGVSKGLATVAALGIAWSLVSWIPHSAMHQTNAAADFARLIVIEYLFHVTLIGVGAILALYAYRVAQASSVTAVHVQDSKKPVVAMR